MIDIRKSPQSIMISIRWGQPFEVKVEMRYLFLLFRR